MTESPTLYDGGTERSGSEARVVTQEFSTGHPKIMLSGFGS